MKSKQFGVPLLALLGSASTLVCCVIPALLVALGFGSALAGFIGAFPQITWLSEHKGIVFGGAGALIAIAGLWEYKRRNDPCPIDPELARACGKLRKFSVGLWILSALIFAVSVFFVFILPRFME